jgi:hypothetical protein
MGQRYVQLNNTYTASSDGSAILHVSQVPPNAAILPPGPALLYVVVDGIPSTGSWVMIGNGQLGAQTVSAVEELTGTLPGSSKKSETTSSSDSSSSSKDSGSSTKDSAAGSVKAAVGGVLAAVVGAVVALAW